MKKAIFACIPLCLLPLLALAGCGKKVAPEKYLSEVKSDIFVAETEEFSLTLSCTEREYPYADDGIACPRSKLCEISIVTKTSADYSVFVLGEKSWGGETSYRNVRGDYYYSQGVEVFPEKSVTLRIQWEEETREIVATSVKTEKTISPEKALGEAVKSEKEAISRMTREGEFFGEYRVRLLKRDSVYYYVGIVDKNGHTISLLLDSETGEVLARRESAT